MKKRIFVFVCAALAFALLCSCGMPMSANYSSPTIKVDAVTSAGSYNSAPAADVPVPETSPEPLGVGLVITKDPTDETVPVGEGVWFVARAKNLASMRWELIDNYGNVCSPEQAEQQNGGLLVAYPAEDTISLNNVPLSMDGWSVRAVFEGEGGPLTGKAAKITVIDYENPYSTVIMRYGKAFRYGIPTLDYCQANGISERAAECWSVGYALYDIDENGVDELFIAAWDTNAAGYKRNLIFELYTILDNEPYRIYCSKGGSELYLIDEGRLLSVSTAPGMTSNGIYRLANDFLIYEEVYIEETDPSAPGRMLWRHRVDNSIGYSDDRPISTAEAIEAIDSLHALTCLPDLIPIV